MTSETQVITSAPALLSRLAWMIVGPFALVICAVRVAEQPDGWFGLLDWIYFLVLGGTIFARWTEYRSGQSTTATGEPATVNHLLRYTLVLGIIGVGIWIGANLAGNHTIRILG